MAEILACNTLYLLYILRDRSQATSLLVSVLLNHSSFPSASKGEFESYIIVCLHSYNNEEPKKRHSTETQTQEVVNYQTSKQDLQTWETGAGVAA